MGCKKIRIITLVCSAIISNIIAQDFQYKTTIDPVPEKSYYEIYITPAIAGLCKLDLQDLRIMDVSNKEIPYLIQKNIQTKINENYKPLPIIERKSYNRQSIYVIDRYGNSDKPIILKIINADIEKSLKFEGSNDKNEWFAVQFTQLNPYYLPGDSIKEATINLPLSNYRYLKCIVNDSTSGKIKLKSFGIQEYLTQKVDMASIPSPILKQQENDSIKCSIIEIQFNQPYLVNKLLFEIKSDWDFYREVSLEKYIDSPTGGHYTTISSSRFASYFNLNTIELDNTITQKLRLVIRNLDNPPLKISAVNAYQSPISIIVPLEPERRYIIFYGKASLAAPQYDLVHFEEKLKTTLPRARLGSVIKLPTLIVEKPKQNLNNYYIGISILLVALLLIFMTWKMLKEMKLKSQDQL